MFLPNVFMSSRFPLCLLLFITLLLKVPMRSQNEFN